MLQLCMPSAIIAKRVCMGAVALAQVVQQAPIQRLGHHLARVAWLATILQQLAQVPVLRPAQREPIQQLERHLALVAQQDTAALVPPH